MKPEDRERLAEQWLDAGLKELGQGEPRIGLEARVLANLRAGAEEPRWWLQWWPALAMVVAVVVASSFVLLTRTESRPAVVTVTALPAEVATRVEKAEKKNGAGAAQSRVRPRLKVSTPQTLSNASTPTPRLEQFPSPQPLSAQEEMLARYVDEKPQEAGMMARMNSELLKQDLLEFERHHSALEESQDLKQ